jgi:integrase
MPNWMAGWRPTRSPGIFEGRSGYRVRVRAIDSRTGTLKEVNRTYDKISLKEAVAKQAELREELLLVEGRDRPRVGAFAKSWLELKAISLDARTLRQYASVLEDHVLPVLGDFFLDAVRREDVQALVNRGLRKGYGVRTVHGWFRVLRTMYRDAMAEQDLPRDPTMRIVFPEASEKDDPNALCAEELRGFLDAMRVHHPQHFGLVAVLAFTGLRFCHASALRWEDMDEQAGVLRIRRKQVLGLVGQVSRKKRAPKEIPLAAELTVILKDHRQRLLESQAPGFAEGWMFPSEVGTLRSPSSVKKAWLHCIKVAGIKGHFTVHGLRRTFNDLTRRAGVDAVVIRSLTGHVTEQMREHYSSVALDEKRAAVAGVLKLVSGPGSGDSGGDTKGGK